MSIVIDYDMPVSCYECVGLYGHSCRFREGVSTRGHGDDRPLACPIIGEIPDKHGRLIDVDKLCVVGITDYTLKGHTVVELEDVQNAPIVLEATE